MSSRTRFCAAYEVQRAIVTKKVAQGARVIGKKIGLTSRANQEVFGVHEPVYGQLRRLYHEAPGPYGPGWR